ncbi:hypothetical protein JL722_15129 [Aureococcus anophagefferens]|nr:hypothetical protein JL722_15129 [Aureococcus anophagefferens]
MPPKKKASVTKAAVPITAMFSKKPKKDAAPSPAPAAACDENKKPSPERAATPTPTKPRAPKKRPARAKKPAASSDDDDFVATGRASDDDASSDDDDDDDDDESSESDGIFETKKKAKKPAAKRAAPRKKKAVDPAMVVDSDTVAAPVELSAEEKELKWPIKPVPPAFKPKAAPAADDDDEASPATSKKRKSKSSTGSAFDVMMKSAKTPSRKKKAGDDDEKFSADLDNDLPVISRPHDIFADIVRRFPEIGELAKSMDRPLRVATMLIFSATAPLLFRDVRELGNKRAHTAFGALEDVPQDRDHFDVLIAGTSCVDYSNLNDHKKTLDQGGESGQTFYGMHEWVQRARPTLVLLENVCGAPWGGMIKNFADIKYHARHSRLDTKHFYLPQTRTRGYLLAVAHKRCGPGVLDAWEEKLAKMRRAASASLEAFMLAPDDPRVSTARADLKHVSRNKNDVPWEKCEARHARVRGEEKLGQKRPVTNWSHGTNNASLPDFAWRDWAHAQTERVLDSIDIDYMRLVQKKVDASFKTSVWDLSQNVDRSNPTNSKLGICPCLTPSLCAYVTNQGRPVIGVETLALQGIPIDDLLLTRESEDNLTSLSGNAMSTTVVGSALLAALLVLPMESLENMGLASETAAKKAKKGVEEAADEAAVAVKESAMAAPRALPMGALDDVASPLFEAGTPPRAFEKALAKALPGSVVLAGVGRAALEKAVAGADGVDDSILDAWLDHVADLDGTELRQAGVARGDDWKATFADAAGKFTAELRVGDGSPEWLVYAAAPPGKGALRDAFKTPVLRGSTSPEGGLLSAVSWSARARARLRTPRSRDGGDLIDTFESTFAMEDGSVGSKRHSVITVEGDASVAGTYDAAQVLRGAWSLHKKRGGDVYFFLESEPVGKPENDGGSRRRKRRRNFKKAELSRSVGAVAPVWCALPGASLEAAAGRDGVVAKVEASLSGAVDLSTARRRLSRAPVRRARRRRPGDARRRLVAQGRARRLGAPRGREIGRVRRVATQTSREIGFVTPRLELPGRWGLVLRGPRRGLRRRPREDGHVLRGLRPRRPPWWAKEAGKRSTTFIAVEDPYSAGVYERALKHRPSTFAMQARLDSKGGKGELRVAVNARAALRSLLPRVHARREGDTVLEWRVVPGEPTFQRERAPNRPFGLTSNRGDASRSPTRWAGARRRASAPTTVRGGVLADAVGYGKTAITLALIDETKTDEPPALPAYHVAADGAPKAIPCKATLIVVPKHLMAQWPSELKKFLGGSAAKKYNVITIATMLDLKKLTVAKMLAADIVFVAAEGPDALRKARKADKARDEVTIAVNTSKKQAYKDAAPLRGAREKTAAPKKKKAEKPDEPMPDAPTTTSPWTTRTPIVDEYTYLEARDVPTIHAIKARSSWVLSGTPPIDSFDDVKSIAAFLGVHLGAADPVQLTKKGTVARSDAHKELSKSEMFHEFMENRSESWHARRRDLAQAFVNRFVRQNVAEIDEIPFVEHARSVDLPSAERAVYLELEHHLRALEMQTSKHAGRGRAGSARSDREARLREALRAPATPHEALLKRCAYSTLDGGAKGAPATVVGACDLVVARREAELDECANQIRREVAARTEGELRRWDAAPMSGPTVKSKPCLDAFDKFDSATGMWYAEDVGGSATGKKRKAADRVCGHKHMRELADELAGGYGDAEASAKLLAIVDEAKQDAAKSPNCSLAKPAAADDSDDDASDDDSDAPKKKKKPKKKAKKKVDEKDRAKYIEDVSYHHKIDTLVFPEPVVSGESEPKRGARRDAQGAHVGVAEPGRRRAQRLGIKTLKIKGSAHQMMNAMTAFQAETLAKDDPRVLLLELHNESAAGANLTTANHAIFVHPLHVDKLQTYMACETQAIGRVRRYGQKRTVNLYRFLAADTVDSRLFESRRDEVADYVARAKKSKGA